MKKKELEKDKIKYKKHIHNTVYNTKIYYNKQDLH